MRSWTSGQSRRFDLGRGRRGDGTFTSGSVRARARLFRCPAKTTSSAIPRVAAWVLRASSRSPSPAIRKRASGLRAITMPAAVIRVSWPFWALSLPMVVTMGAVITRRIRARVLSISWPRSEMRRGSNGARPNLLRHWLEALGLPFPRTIRVHVAEPPRGTLCVRSSLSFSRPCHLPPRLRTVRSSIRIKPSTRLVVMHVLSKDLPGRATSADQTGEMLGHGDGRIQPGARECADPGQR